MPRSRAFFLESGWPVVLKDLGLDPVEILRRAELPDDLFSREVKSLTSPEYFRLWRAVEQSVEDPTFPLILANVIQTESFHPAIFAALCSSNFAMAAKRLSEHKRLIMPVRLHVDEDPHSLTLRCEWLERTVQAPYSLEMTELAMLLKLARMATRESIKALEVGMPTLPRPSKPYTEFFGVRVRRADMPLLRVSMVDAQRPFLTANEAMWRAFAPELRRRLAELDQEATLGERVRATLLEALPGGESSIDQICRRLAVSKRSLQRRLREEGTSFQQILNATREELARHYLARTSLSGAEISYLLGFADPNSFFRAFHAWTGETTEQVRLAHAR